MFVLLILGTCVVGMITIIVDADHCRLPGELSTDEADNSGFFSTQRVCMVSYRSSKTTGSSLIGAQWQC